MERKLNILIVHNYYQFAGGEDVVVENESNLLKKNGHKVVLYTRHNNEIKNYNLLKKVLLFFDTIFSIRTYKEVKRIIKQEKIDIVHVHNTMPLISPSVYWAAFKSKVPVIQTIHNFRLVCPNGLLFRNNTVCEDCINHSLFSAIKHKCYKNSFLNTLAVITMLKFNRVIGTYKKVNKYIVLSDFSKHKLEKIIESGYMEIKKNFIPNDDFENNLELNNKLQLEIDNNYFIFAGRLEASKGIFFLIDAWKEIEDLKLYIFGSGPEENNIKELINLNKINNIKIFGKCERNKLFNYIKKSKAVIVPSLLYEGLPMIIIETFAFGKPIVATKIGNLKELIKEGKNGLLFSPNNKEEFKEKICRLIKDDNLYRSLCEGAYKEFIDNYSERINYSEIMRIYNNLLGENNE